MRLVFIVFLFTAAASNANTSLNVVSDENVPSAPLPANGSPVDEVVVESSLFIKPKSKPVNMRRLRRQTKHMFDTHFTLDHRRNKRFPQFGQSQAAANAAANNFYYDPYGNFGSSAANAQSQAFNAKGPSAGFGAASAGSVTQALNAGDNIGVQNSAGASMSQSYVLPNGKTISFAATNSFANGPLGTKASSRGGAVSVSQK